MKTISVVLLWFAFIGAVAFLTSCKSSYVHCDAYGKVEQVSPDNSTK
jgi:hypothetical protein